MTAGDFNAMLLGIICHYQQGYFQACCLALTYYSVQSKGAQLAEDEAVRAGVPVVKVLDASATEVVVQVVRVPERAPGSGQVAQKRPRKNKVNTVIQYIAVALLDSAWRQNLIALLGQSTLPTSSNYIWRCMQVSEDRHFVQVNHYASVQSVCTDAPDIDSFICAGRKQRASAPTDLPWACSPEQLERLKSRIAAMRSAEESCNPSGLASVAFGKAFGDSGQLKTSEYLLLAGEQSVSLHHLHAM